MLPRGAAPSFLAILGLSGLLPIYMLPVAGIVLGLAFVTLGSVGAIWARMFRFAEHETLRERIAYFGGLAAAVIAGVAAVVLGILNLAFVADVRLTAIAVLALGLGLLCTRCHVARDQFTHDARYHGAEAIRPSGPFAANALSRRRCGTSFWERAARSWESWRY